MLHDPPDLNGFRISVGCRAAREGRDYLHFFPLANDRLGIVIAYYGSFVFVEKLRAQLSSEVASCLEQESDLGRAIERLNDRMVEFISPGSFLTLLAFVLSGSSSDVSAVNAGHYGPVIFRASSSTVERPLPSGDDRDLPIAIDKGMNYSAINLSLHDGDTVALFTDGIPEAMNPDKEFFGVESIARLLAMRGDADTIRDRIMKAVIDHVGAREQFDDITLVVIQRVKD